jgi:hypothetical protein
MSTGLSCLPQKWQQQRLVPTKAGSSSSSSNASLAVPIKRQQQRLAATAQQLIVMTVKSSLPFRSGTCKKFDHCNAQEPSKRIRL